jgi:hypothetical protein
MEVVQYIIIQHRFVKNATALRTPNLLIILPVPNVFTDEIHNNTRQEITE